MLQTSLDLGFYPGSPRSPSSSQDRQQRRSGPASSMDCRVWPCCARCQLHSRGKPGPVLMGAFVQRWELVSGQVMTVTHVQLDREGPAPGRSAGAAYDRKRPCLSSQLSLSEQV